MNRRAFLKGVLGAAAAIALPPTLTENAEEARHYWSLDQTMVTPRYGQTTYRVGQSYNPFIETHLATAAEYVSPYLHVEDASLLRAGDILRIMDYYPGTTLLRDPNSFDTVKVLAVIGDDAVAIDGPRTEHIAGSLARVVSRAVPYSEPFEAPFREVTLA